MKLGDVGLLPARCSPVVEALLSSEREIVPQVAIVRARALARARETLRAGGGGRLTAPSLPEPSRWLLFAAAAGVLLLASGAAAYQLFHRSGVHPPSGASVPRLAQADQPAPQAAGAAAPVAPGKATQARVAPAARATDVTASLSEDSLADELRLLERAQHSAARGDYTAVLVATSEHERRYFAGRLCEEREALRVRALIGLGRGQDARRAVVRFRRDFPHSVLLPRLDDMLVSL